MAETWLSIAKHMVGLDRRKPYRRHGRLFFKPERNFYAVSCQSADLEILEGMEANGLVRRNPPRFQFDMYVFSLTEKGAEWLGGELGVTIKKC